MRRHYRNHLTARRRDAVARMVQPPLATPAGMPMPVSRVPSQLSPGMSMAPVSVPVSVPMYALSPQSASTHTHLLAPMQMHHPHPQAQMQTQTQGQGHATGSRSGSTPISGYGSGSRSPSRSRSRSGSCSPSPVPSPSPSPLPSPVSAVTSPFPPTPRSLPVTTFRASSPARSHPGSVGVGIQVNGYYHPGSEKQQQTQQYGERASPAWSASADDFDEDEDLADELDVDTEAPLTATPSAPESYVRGDRTSSGSGSERRRPRAESSPESRRARPYPYPYPSPRARQHRLSSSSASALSDGGLGGEGREGKCEVPGCGCAAGRGAGGRLRPAFQDVRERENGNPGWTVLEDDPEDG